MWNIIHSMETIQIVLDGELLRATDHAAKRARINRSALVRRAIREHLKNLEMQELVARERRGYRKQPSHRKEAAIWERVAVWPES